jgi:hypothetical protein
MCPRVRNEFVALRRCVLNAHSAARQSARRMCASPIVRRVHRSGATRCSGRRTTKISRNTGARCSWPSPTATCVQSPRVVLDFINFRHYRSAMQSISRSHHHALHHHGPTGRGEAHACSNHSEAPPRPVPIRTGLFYCPPLCSHASHRTSQQRSTV